MQDGTAGGAHKGQGVLGHQEGAAHIHRHHRVEVGHVGFIDLGAARDAGAVHHRVDAAEAVQRVPDLFLIGNVAEAMLRER